MIKVINGDCIEVMKSFSDNSFDLIFTSPPYAGVKTWKEKNERFEDMIKRLKELNLSALKECSRLIREGRFIVWNITDIPYNETLIPNVSDTINYAVYELKLNYIAEVIWDKGISRILPSVLKTKPVIPSYNHEHLLFFCKGKKKRINERIDRNHVNLLNSIWKFRAVMKNRITTPFPIELAKSVIELTTIKNEDVLDCFSGQGTTLIACKLLDRNCIGIEIREDLCKLTEELLNKIPQKLDFFFNSKV